MALVTAERLSYIVEACFPFPHYIELVLCVLSHKSKLWATCFALMMMLDEKLRDKQMLTIYSKEDMNEYIKFRGISFDS